jgi:hypothetical protein
MQRTDLMDTSNWAHRALVKRLREMTPQEKARLLDARIEEMRQMRKHTEALRVQKAL